LRTALRSRQQVSMLHHHGCSARSVALALWREGSRYAPLVDVLIPVVLADGQLERRPEFGPLVGAEFREGDALWNSYLVPIDENHIVVTGPHAQLLVDAVLGALRVLVEPDVTANAEVHLVPGDAARPHDLNLRAFAVAHAIQDAARQLVGRDQPNLAVSAH